LYFALRAQIVLVSRSQPFHEPLIRRNFLSSAEETSPGKGKERGTEGEKRREGLKGRRETMGKRAEANMGYVRETVGTGKNSIRCSTERKLP